MVSTMVWPGLVACLQICILMVAAKHQSPHEDLLADMLIPINMTRSAQGIVRRSAEGTGYDDLREIRPMPQGVGTFMERLQEEVLAHASDKRESMEDFSSVGKRGIEIDEGSGDGEEEPPPPNAAATRIYDSFHHEEGMEDVTKDLSGDPDRETIELRRDDDNRQENTLNVLASDKRPVVQTEDEDSERHEAPNEDKEEGSGFFPPESKHSSRSDETDESNARKLIDEETEDTTDDERKSEDSKTEVGKFNESESEAVIPVDENNDSQEGTEKYDEAHIASITKLESQEGNDGEEATALEQTVEDNDGIIEEHEEGEVIGQIPEISPMPGDVEHEFSTTTPSGPEITDSEELTETKEATTIQETEMSINAEAASTEQPTTLAPTIEGATSEAPTTIIEVAEFPITTTDSSAIFSEMTTPEERAAVSTSTTEVEEAVTTPTTTEDEIITTTEVTETTTEGKAAILIVKEDQESAGEPSTQIPLLESTTEDFSSEVEIVNATVLLTATKEATANEKTGPLAKPPNIKESSASRSVSMYIIVGILIICFIVLVAVVTLRNRGRRRKLRMDSGQDRDPEKALLGKYKDDSEENTVKNNEITPLVIKQNSQINKFEKNPNFSSPKNLNTTANEKNIEKDNVLKSTTQAIIEGDVEDVKKAVEDEVEEEKKRAVEELGSLAAEKVVVRTHMDLDSIPRKPVLVNRNGHTYHPVPGGETKT